MKHAVFIPKEIWGLPLSCEERCLLAHIYYYEQSYGECNSDNRQISEELHVTESRVRSLIKKLEEKRFLLRNIETISPPWWKKEEKPSSRRKLYIRHEVQNGK